MQNVDDKMDELFQKAADHYPLKTNTGNFDQLLPLIGIETNTTQVNPASAGRKRKTAFLLLAFLISGLEIGTTYLLTQSSNHKTINSKASVEATSNTPVENIPTPEINIIRNVAIPAKASTENNFSTEANNHQKNKLTSNTKGSVFTQLLSPVAETDEYSKSVADQRDDVRHVENNTATNIIDQPKALDKAASTKDKKETIVKAGKIKDTAIFETKTTDKKDKKEKSKNKYTLYYGIAAGAEYNEVKNQSMTKAGLNAGLVLGLQIHSTTSIETGVQLSQKKYYSDGKYFKPKAGTMPANMLVNSLQSTSTIIEIPVSVKYNFSKKKNTFYSKVGVSTYILTKESNKYQAVINGQQQEINSTYNNNHSYFASDLRISAGYQHAVGKKINIRLEPYVQIPLKGIGVGNMPVTTAGLQLILIQN